MQVDGDRAAGALLGLAAGDALGAGYEFTRPDPSTPIVMTTGVMGFAPGEWTDDTAQAVGIARVTATGSTDVPAVGAQFLEWYATDPRDVGTTTRAALGSVTDAGGLAAAARAHFDATGRGAGNGSLMRTAPVALARLGDDAAIARLATDVSLLTHGDPLAAEACVIWAIAVDRAVRLKSLDVRSGIDQLPPGRKGFWHDAIDAAQANPPDHFAADNGFVVVALQAAWSAIHHTPVPTDQPCRHLERALETAVRIGNDTDTVAAIAGQLLGARYGSSAVPWRWRRMLHGWGAEDADDLTRLAILTARRGSPDHLGWPGADSLVDVARARGERQVFCTAADHDPDLLLGNLPGLPVAVEHGVNAVVSLCRTGHRETPPGVEHHRFWLIDQPEATANPNLEFVVDQAVQAVRTLRAEGKRVYLHCWGGRSRSATVAALVAAEVTGEDSATTLGRITAALPEARPNPAFGQLLRRRLG
ncbi:MAG TPA: ADP-ribosylglycohydrolase family protein [Euzebya sp.]|nr:ADP-ribosylglycohydrolase family protein [Euzebya sp.]